MRDRSPVWIGMVDMALAVLAVALVAVNPPKAESGVPLKAEYLITVDWAAGVDADVDNWMITPTSHKPVFYASRDVGCAKLDQDSRGFLNSRIELADGSKIDVDTVKETISLRCIEPGRYDLGVNLYAWRDTNKDGIKVHAELVQINPVVKVLFAKDIVLDKVGQTINWASFDLTRDGRLTLVDPPLALITAKWQNIVHGGYP